MSEKYSAIFLRLAAVLLVLVLLSSSLVTGRFARYVTTASGEDTARVARFSVTESGDLMSAFNIELYPGASKNYTIAVQNDSEVYIAYTIVATNQSGNLPLTFEISGMEQDGNSNLAGTMAPGVNAEYTMTVRWPEEENSPALSGKVDRILVTLNATQID